MLVEDDPTVTLGVIGALELIGYEVCATTSTGENAVELAQTLSPDVILMDVDLEGELDGIAAALKISERRRSSIIFLTAQQNEFACRAASSVYNFGFLRKPFELESLACAIRASLFQNIEKAFLGRAA